MSLEHRIAVVTGASAGIGLFIARDLAALGAKVVVNARRRERLEGLVASLPAGRAAAADGDAADPAVIRRMLDTARDVFGGGVREADLVVINAGRGLNGSVMSSDTAQWGEMVRTNYLGCAHLLREAGARMLAMVAGRSGPAAVGEPRDIIVLGSTVGRNVSPFSSMYGSTKFAVHGLVEGARRELGPKGVRVSLIEPGFVESEFQGVAGYDPAWFEGVKERIGPVLTPGDVASTVSFVATRPPHVHVADILIRPTRQDYP
jgi:NADP-dependent 3-hydroxy acid dehydrogenase YdfG